MSRPQQGASPVGAGVVLFLRGQWAQQAPGPPRGQPHSHHTATSPCSDAQPLTGDRCQVHTREAKRLNSISEVLDASIKCSMSQEPVCGTDAQQGSQHTGGQHACAAERLPSLALEAAPPLCTGQMSPFHSHVDLQTHAAHTPGPTHSTSGQARPAPHTNTS